MKDKTLLPLSVKLEYQLVLALQMLLFSFERESASQP